MWAPGRDLRPFAFVSHAFGNPLHLVLDALQARCPAGVCLCGRLSVRSDPAETRVNALNPHRRRTLRTATQPPCSCGLISLQVRRYLHDQIRSDAIRSLGRLALTRARACNLRSQPVGPNGRPGVPRRGPARHNRPLLRNACGAGPQCAAAAAAVVPL